MIIIILSTLQVIGGIIYSFVILKASNNKSVKKVGLGHLINGAILYVLTKANLFIGLCMSTWSNYVVYLIALVIVIASLRTVQEVYQHVVNVLKKRQHKKLNLKDSDRSNHQALLELLNANSTLTHAHLLTVYLAPVHEIAIDHRLLGLKWSTLR